ncbi:hypothetical protein V511_09630 [Mesotoga sp. Brook.08.YT.4.2.5.1]|nr:hypothetical protein V511_09630 [Mesotoga sp. Brook.08.YT.4.2.5.1]RAO96633.1 hypothetical protein M388_13605 [Mesotoga sp. Brook.08.YT.4.2.5.4.]RDI93341.1 hypothetical protein Q502_06365 [Mesotoga sp. Brook.08.YT.4.2.5.2.]
MKLIGILNVKAKIGTDRLLMSVPLFAYWKNSFLAFAFITCSVTLATDGLLAGRRTVDLQRSVRQRSAKSGLCCLLPKAALRPGVVFASLASRHDPLPALRPPMLFGALRLIN